MAEKKEEKKKETPAKEEAKPTEKPVAKKEEKKQAVEKKPEPAKKQVEKKPKKETPVAETPLKKVVDTAKEKAGLKEEEVKEERKIIKESLHTVPLRKAYDKPRSQRARAAIKLIRQYMRKHTRKETVKISEDLNKAIWARAIQKPPRRVKIKIEEEETVATAQLV